MHFTKLIFYSLTLVINGINSLLAITDVSYTRMPPLNDFDKFDECLMAEASATYCVVYAEIKANPDNDLWQRIHNFSLDYRRHFRHDHLFFGVCVERCRKLYAETKGQNYVPDIRDKEIIDLYELVYSYDENVNVDRRNYSVLLNHCLNADFQNKYNLTLETFIEYCEKSERPLDSIENDLPSIIFLMLLVLLASLVIFSSCYDFSLKLKVPKSQLLQDFYKIEHSKRDLIILTAFSVCRNFHRITMMRSPRKTQLSEDLRFFDGIKAIGMFLVIMSHIALIFLVTNHQNSDFFEKIFSSPENALFENGTAIMQVFFCMSAFLFHVHFKKLQMVDENSSISQAIRIYFKVNTYRYLRLAPSLFFILLFTASALTRLYDGPFWRHITESEQTFCRLYWWKIVFLINDSRLHEKSCLHHTWYLATDMQLFEFFVIVILISLKYPKLTKPLYAALIVLSLLLPAVVTYALDMEGSYRANPESYRYLYFKNGPEFYESYAPFYMNLSGYLAGILCAEMYLRMKSNESNFLITNRAKYNVLWWLLPPSYFGLCFIGHLWLLNESRIAHLSFAGFYRPIWSLLFALALLGLCYKLGWIILDFLNWPSLRILGRISYQIYLWHPIVARFIIAFYREPPVVSVTILLIFTIAGFVLTTVLAFLMALLFEYPFKTILAACFKGRREETAAIENEPGANDYEIKESTRV